MSEHENTFINELKEEFKAFKLEIDEKYKRMQGFLISIIVVLIGAGITVNFTHFTKDGETRASVANNTKTIEYLMENSVSQQAIDKLIITFENQNEVMLKFFPKDIQGAIEEMNKMNRNTRSQIIMFNSSLNNRGALIPEGDGQY